MSFRINKSHKFADQFPNGKDGNKSSSFSDLLTSEDYLLFNLGENSSRGNSSVGVAAKPKKGGNSIRPVNSAQADYY